MRKLKAAGIPVVAVMVTGRPLFVNEALNEADAFVTAWLPGSEGAGVADLLFARKDGTMAFDFQGRLPTAWPATARHDGPRSEEHTSELQSLMRISYAVFCLKKKK